MSLATSHVTDLNWKDTYVLDEPAKVIESPEYWEIHFGRPEDRQADPAFAAVRVDKKTEGVAVIPQK